MRFTSEVANYENQPHQPVLCAETATYLVTISDGLYIDGTLGFGGHTQQILNRLGADGKIFGFDLDPEAISYCRQRFRGESRLRIIQESFRELDQMMQAQNIFANGVLLDLGLSSLQIDNPQKGFSFSCDGPLDMRFNPKRGIPAADLLNTFRESEIADIIYQYGEERRSRQIAKRIVKYRRNKKISTTTELVNIIHSVSGHIKTVARVFQAIRIAVNDELNALKDALIGSQSILSSGGRLVVISYHSLEDRIVKRFIQNAESTCVCPPLIPICQCNKQQEMKVITRKPITPSGEEISKNPRARSAKMRVAEKV